MAEKADKVKKVIVPKCAADIQRFKLEKLMKNPKKPVSIQEKADDKLPRVFNPPEFIRNVWGSSAGAGSGDFHVYRGVRRREYARQKFNNEKAIKDELIDAYAQKVEQNKKEAVERTAKKRAKRQKKKMNQKAKKAKKSDVKKDKPETESEESDEEDEEENKEASKEENGKHKTKEQSEVKANSKAKNGSLNKTENQDSDQQSDSDSDD